MSWSGGNHGDNQPGGAADHGLVPAMPSRTREASCGRFRAGRSRTQAETKAGRGPGLCRLSLLRTRRKKEREACGNDAMGHRMSESGKGEARGHCKSAKEHLVQIGGPAVPAYWKGPEELRNGPRRTAEFPGGLPSSAAGEETTRRDFLAAMGFTVAALGLSGCRAPVQNAITLLVGSDEIIPGVANWYDTTCRGCASH